MGLQEPPAATNKEAPSPPAEKLGPPFSSSHNGEGAGEGGEGGGVGGGVPR